MTVIKGKVIELKTGFSIQELIEKQISYVDCTFIMDKDAEYCVYINTNTNTNITLFTNCTFKRAEGSTTVGYKAHVFNYEDTFNSNPIHEIEKPSRLDFQKYLPIVELLNNKIDIVEDNSNQLYKVNGYDTKGDKFNAMFSYTKQKASENESIKIHSSKYKKLWNIKERIK